ncbi:MAG: DEAD/DEAH box helicase [Pirellulaceae bacterium]|nr:DEAD/DEAH box helicase [Planctomycetales bacterium]
MRHELLITPHGRLSLADRPDGDGTEDAVTVPDELVTAFAESEATAVTLLASAWGGPICASLPASFGFWRQFGQQYFVALRRQYARATSAWQSPVPPDAAECESMLQAAPPMVGLEYATAATMRQLWEGLNAHTQRQVRASKQGLAEYLRQLDPAWNLVGRVTFHLAENKKNPTLPFAFLATYTEGNQGSGAPRHVPLSEALKKSITERDSRKLDELLEPVSRAARSSKLIDRLLESRQLFAPQAWDVGQAYEFLLQLSQMEEAGVVVRVPDWWNASKPPRPQVDVRIGAAKPSNLTAQDTLSFDVGVSIDGEPLSELELKELLAAREGMVLLRGKWVQVDHDRLTSALEHWQTLRDAHVDGIGFLQGMRLLSGATLGDSMADEQLIAWTRIEAGDWLRHTLERLRDPDGEIAMDPGAGVEAQLRHYQEDGVRWLWLATQLGLGVCLADDMGLGKTIQVIALLCQLQRQATKSGIPSLLIVPTSLLGNWQREVTRFAPQLKLFVAHRSMADAETMKRVAKDPEGELVGYDIVATTYGLARKAEWLRARKWRMIILDEAQAIKNAGASQTKAIKSIAGEGRIVLTGTPVENHLGDLWSLFDFCAPGLLGTANQFRKFVAVKDEGARARRLASIRRLVRPYVLRRLKTDPRIAPDLPAKTEMRVDCGLSPKQAGLYEHVLREFAKALESAEDMRRRGLVLSVMMQLKQICNHASLYLKESTFSADGSGKYRELRAICETVIEKQEKMLVFSQFQSMCGPLSQFLETVFGRAGLVLTGKTTAVQRNKLVGEFQRESGPPYFVVSVKAGGTGLNLTEACHVVHFDRWWNPAVEDQATDRAFRIGQKRNVLVHKFVCRGTLEERIDELIQSKRKLSDTLFQADGELNLTEMSNDELMRFVALDINKSTSP